MKKILLYLAAAILVTTAMTSCLKDSDYNSGSSYHTVTATERAGIIQKIRNHYTGHVKYINDSLKIDSIPSTISFVGDTIAMVDFPVSILSNYLTDASLKDNREKLSKAPNTFIECVVQVPTSVLSEYWTNYYEKGVFPNLLFYPKNQVAEFTVDDKKYELTFSYNYLIYNYEYFYPYMQYFDKQAYAFLLLYSIKAPSGMLLYINKPVEFVGKAD